VYIFYFNISCKRQSKIFF